MLTKTAQKVLFKIVCKLEICKSMSLNSYYVRNLSD